MLYPLVTLVFMLLFTGAAGAGAAAVLMARGLLRPPRMSDGKAVWVLRRLSPGDLGLTFQDLRLRVRNAQTRGLETIDIAGWWIPHPHTQGRCVVMLHGYADAKVGAIAWAPTWHALGFNILALDLRAHGESGGRDSTAGFFERHEVSEAIDQLRAERPDQTRQVVLFGVSLGAAVAAATAALRDDVAAAVLESPYADFSRAAQFTFDRSGVPGVLRRMAIGLAQRWSGADFAAMSPVALIPQVRCPVMVIESANDQLISRNDLAAIESALANSPPEYGHRVHWSVAGAPHLLGVAVDPIRYEVQIRQFLASAVPALSEPPAFAATPAP